MQSELEARSARSRIPVQLILGRTHGLEPLRQRQCIAVIASWRYPIATRGWIPRCLGPLDRGLVSHVVHGTARVRHLADIAGNPHGLPPPDASAVQLGEWVCGVSLNAGYGTPHLGDQSPMLAL